MAKWFYGCGFVCAVNAGRRSSSAPIATVGSAIAVCIAGTRPVWISGAAPIVVISRVPKGGSTTAIGSGPTDLAGRWSA